MPTLSLSSFAKLLGFKRISNTRFKRLIQKWEKEGRVKIEQSGYKGDSMHHPKVVTTTEALQVYLGEARKGREAKQIDWSAAEMVLSEDGFKIVRAQSDHKCSACRDAIYRASIAGVSGQRHAHKKLFKDIRLCPKCIRRILDGAEFKVVMRVV